MLHTKRLAYRDGKEIEKPRQLKNLFFGAVCGAALTVFVSCAHAEAVSRMEPAVPKKESPAWILAKPEGEGIKGKCGANLTNTLMKGERYVESKCTGKYEFVLTSEKLRVFPRQRPEAERSDGMSVSFSNMSIETKDLLHAGVVDWEASDSSCYFLLKDRTLVLIPMGEEDKMIHRYAMQFGVSGMGRDSMVYFSGQILLADPRGYVILLPGSDAGKWRRLDLGGPGKNLGLVVKQGRLFAVDGAAPETEIKIGKDGPELAGP